MEDKFETDKDFHEELNYMRTELMRNPDITWDQIENLTLTEVEVNNLSGNEYEIYMELLKYAR
jgi:hypothetical protein